MQTMVKNFVFCPRTMLLSGFLAGSIAFSSIAAPPDQQERSMTPSVAAKGPATPLHTAMPPAISNSVLSSRQALMLRRIWGIDDIHVRYTASGSMIRFSYRIVDADKAEILNDKKVEPYMVVQKTGAKLGVPETEKVGKLRQTPAPVNGREYWMVFTNVGRVLKPGDRVNIVIGTFRADQLVVESSGPVLQVHKP